MPKRNITYASVSTTIQWNLYNTIYAWDQNVLDYIVIARLSLSHLLSHCYSILQNGVWGMLQKWRLYSGYANTHPIRVFGPQSWGTLANYNEQTCSTPDTGKLFHNMAIGIWLRWVIIQELTPFLSTSILAWSTLKTSSCNWCLYPGGKHVPTPATFHSIHPYLAQTKPIIHELNLLVSLSSTTFMINTPSKQFIHLSMWQTWT